MAATNDGPMEPVHYRQCMPKLYLNEFQQNWNQNNLTTNTIQRPMQKTWASRSDECFDRTNVMIEEQEQIMNDQPMSQTFHSTELISLPVM